MYKGSVAWVQVGAAAGEAHHCTLSAANCRPWMIWSRERLSSSARDLTCGGAEGQGRAQR